MKILSRPKRNAEEYGRWAVNPYIGCSHGCKYCYLKSGPSGAYLGQNKPVLKKGIVNEEHAYHLAMAEIIEHRDEIIRDGGLFFSFTSDPCIPETCEVTFKVAEAAMAYKIPIVLLTKDANFCGKDRPTVNRIDLALQADKWRVYIVWDFCDAHQEQLAIGFTLTGHDELESNASPNAERIKAIEYLNGEGWKTWASIEPVIDFPSSFQMIKQALNAGCQHFKIGLMTKNTKVCRNGFTIDGTEFPPYDTAECLAFVQDVMVATKDSATVYWKQSIRDFIGGTPAHRRFSDEELTKIFDNYPTPSLKTGACLTINKIHNHANIKH